MCQNRTEESISKIRGQLVWAAMALAVGCNGVGGGLHVRTGGQCGRILKWHIMW